jgi:hypothetical protein
MTGLRSIISVLALVVSTANGAAAITITYMDTPDSRVFAGFANDASGNPTSDLINHPMAVSRNDTVLGPLPPPFTAAANAGAELGTNLNVIGTGTRSVFAPFNPSIFFQADGQTLTAAGFYSSHAFSYSGNTASSGPTPWVIHIDPSVGETPGTPADVTVTGDISGFVTAAGASVADASWNVATTSNGPVMVGSASQGVPGTTNFSDSGSITFTVPLGGTFELLVDYDLTTSGSGAGAASTSNIASSLVEISAVIPPAMFVPVSGAKLLMIDKYAASSKAKLVLVLKDSTPGSITKGLSADPAGLSGSVEIYPLSNPSNRAVYALDGTNWVTNKDKVAKLKNSSAAPGGGGVKRAVVKPDKLIKVVAKNLGDGDVAPGDQDGNDIDLSSLAPSDVLIAVVTIDNANDGSTHRMCAQFESPTIQSIAGGTGTKVLSKSSTLPATCPW